MITKNEIEKLNKSLKRGDQKSIAELSGVSTVTVNKFFNGNEDLISDEVAARIIDFAVMLIKKRNKVQAASKKLINSI